MNRLDRNKEVNVTRVIRITNVSRLLDETITPSEAGFSTSCRMICRAKLGRYKMCAAKLVRTFTNRVYREKVLKMEI